MPYIWAGNPEAKEEIERLSHDFCYPDGRMCLRRINPNTSLVYTVGVDRNSLADNMFLRSFPSSNNHLAKIVPPVATE
ncbi:ba2ee082-363b-4128-95ff-79d2b27ad39a [Thermothielavioides terrestris]|uniref:Ba2ee082-363b-4128-95ff-79d2b27ad39a n=1 Tax=Thermothielavioides terrestris TaxID=2587410 RepID=A0A3S4CZN6_9PEZI|nr:ba2ee082-363b-4128-95ff-79d2b27ad39a [Thermothielavioides terrestris]